MKKLSNLILFIFVLLFSHYYPKAIISHFGESNPWTSFLYQYGLGAVTFLIGIRLILRSGALKPGRGSDSFWLKVLFGGFVFFMSLHGFWIYYALTAPVKGS